MGYTMDSNHEPLAKAETVCHLGGGAWNWWSWGWYIAVNSIRCLFYLKSEKKEIAHFRSPVFQSEQCLCLAW